MLVLFLYVFLLTICVLKQIMLISEQPVESITECAALVLSIQVDHSSCGLFVAPSLYLLLALTCPVLKISGDSDIIKTLPGDQ